MKPSIWDILAVILVLAIACLACGFTQIFLNPNSTLNPFPPPTAVAPLVIVIEPTATQAVIRTMPATWTPTPTLEGTATASLLLRPSSTIPPTATLFIMPTRTITPTVTRTITATRVDGRCQLVDENPKDDTQFSTNQEFDKRWVLRNLSGDTWRSDSVDIRFKSGTRMQTGADAYDLPRDIVNNDTFDFQVRMRAPSTAGTYNAEWAITTGGSDLCKFYVRIIVK